MPTFALRTASIVVAEFGREPDGHAELPVGLEQRGRHAAAEGRLHDGVDVAGVQPVARRLFAVDLDVEVGLAEHPEDAEIGRRPRTCSISCMTCVGELFELGEVGADDLDRVGAFDARRPSSTLS